MGTVQSAAQVQVRLAGWRLSYSSAVWSSKTTVKKRIIYPQVDSKHPKQQEPISKQPPHSQTWFKDVPEVTISPKTVPLTALPEFDRNSCQFIIFDLETTGLETKAEICQIASMAVNDLAVWSTYILPTCAINPLSSLVTGLVVKNSGNERYLTFCGKYVKTLSYKEGIHSFYSHLKTLSTKAKHTILIGYNSKTFDIPILFRSFDKVGVTASELDTFGIGFVDAMSVLNDMKKSRQLQLNKPSSTARGSLEEVYKHLFNETFRAHEAVKDISALYQVLFKSRLPITTDHILTHTITAGSSYKAFEFNEHKYKLLKTMKGRLFNDPSGLKLVISKHVAKKIATSGLNYKDLERVYQQYGREGISNVCSTQVHSQDGKMTYRVTNNMPIINAIADHFEKATGLHI